MPCKHAYLERVVRRHLSKVGKHGLENDKGRDLQYSPALLSPPGRRASSDDIAGKQSHVTLISERKLGVHDLGLEVGIYPWTMIDAVIFTPPYSPQPTREERCRVQSYEIREKSQRHVDAYIRERDLFLEVEMDQ